VPTSPIATSPTATAASGGAVSGGAVSGGAVSGGAVSDEAVECVVLVDDDGRAVGTMPKAAVHTRETPLHLAFSCYAFDRRRRLLMTRRAESKSTWPGVWTNTCCGHPAPGEPVQTAVARRLRQELGLSALVLVPVLPLFRYRAVMDNGIVENEICPVFVAVVSDVPSPDPAEVATTRWVDWKGFRDLATAPRPSAATISPWAREQVAELAHLGAAPDDWPADADRERLTRLFDA